MDDEKLILSYAKPTSRLDLRWLIAAAILTGLGLLLLAAIWMPTGPRFLFDGPTIWGYGYFNYLKVVDPHFFPPPSQRWTFHFGALATSIVLTLADLVAIAWCWWQAFHRLPSIEST